MKKAEVLAMVNEAGGTWLRASEHPFVIFGDAAKVLDDKKAECDFIDLEITEEMFSELRQQSANIHRTAVNAYISIDAFRIFHAPSEYIWALLEHGTMEKSELSRQFSQKVGNWPDREVYL